MKYLRVGWKHQHADEPIMLYSELDGNRWEVRKVEIFRDGRHGYASVDGAAGGTMLGEVPVPEVREIAKERDFDPVEITQAEFEAVWLDAIQSVDPTSKGRT